ncbi:MAG: DUF2069 domain-containing protein [Steroidobacteraceae bacterium]|nr:DUF2069 domain-containing protein [Steroidobacteraceae bacterium]
MSQPRADHARLAVLAVWGLLALTLLAWYAITLPRVAAVVAVLLTVAPLALPLPGLMARRRRSYRWAPLTLAPAMTWSLTEFVANPAARPYALVAGLLAFAGLAAVVAWLRSESAAQ